MYTRIMFFMVCVLSIFYAAGQSQPKPLSRPQGSKPVKTQALSASTATNYGNDISGCDLLLKDGVFNTLAKRNTSISTSEWNSYWCSGEVRQTSSSGKTGASLSLGFMDIDLGIGFDEAKAFQDSYKKVFCGSTRNQQFHLGDEALVQKIVDPAILRAYIDCRNAEQKGFSVISQASDNLEFVTVTLKFQPIYVGQSPPNITTVSVGPDDAIISKSGSLASKVPIKLDENSKSLIIQRRPDKILSVNIETNLGPVNINYPPVIPPPSTQELLLAAFPKGTILIWGTKLPVPKGWAVCDGANGTIDLKNKFAQGTNDLSLIGTSVGNQNVTPSGTAELGKKTGPIAWDVDPEKHEKGQALAYDRKQKNEIKLDMDSIDITPLSTKVMYIIKIQ